MTKKELQAKIDLVEGDLTEYRRQNNALHGDLDRAKEREAEVEALDLMFPRFSSDFHDKRTLVVRVQDHMKQLKTDTERVRGRLASTLAVARCLAVDKWADDAEQKLDYSLEGGDKPEPGHEVSY